MPRMRIFRKVLYKPHEKVQKLPIKFARPKIVNTKWGEDSTIELEVECDEEESELSVLRIRVTTNVIKRDKKISRLIDVLHKKGVNYYIYEAGARHNANEVSYYPLESGVQFVQISGKSRLNVKCPIRIIDGAPHLVYRSDLRANNVEYVVVLVDLLDLAKISPATEAGVTLCTQGRCVQVETIHRRYCLYVDSGLIPVTEEL